MSRLSQILTNAAVTLVAVAICFGMGEIVLWFFAGYGREAAEGRLYRYDDLYVSDKPIAVFDQVSGYRRLPGPTRYVRIVHDQVVWDNTYTPNNVGYMSHRDYVPAKAPGTTRVAILGDSFTGPAFIKETWPDRVNDALRGHTKHPLELYSFSQEGAGLGNWHGIFFDDIVPHYAFDALVIADFGDDLARKYSYLHYVGSTSYIGYFPTRAASDEDFFANYFPQMKRHVAVVESDREIDETIASLREPWRRPAFQIRSLPLLKSQWQRIRSGHLRSPPAAAVPAPPPVANPTLEGLEAAYGPSQFGLLRDIAEYCKAKGIPMIFVAIPDRDGATKVAQSKGAYETPHQREVRFLADQFGAAYMDGYAAFADVPPEDIDKRYWFKFDGHWNQAGSDRFAKVMTQYLSAHESQLSPER